MLEQGTPSDQETPITQVLYVSRRLPAVTDPIVKSIVRHAVDRNAVLGVSGLLLVGHAWFVQLLEGEDRCVDYTFKRIRLDKRHSDVCVMLRREAPQRLCPSWGMVHFPSDLAWLAARQSTQPVDFDPYQSASSELLHLCVAAAQQRASQ